MSHQAQATWTSQGLSFLVLGGTRLDLWRPSDFDDVGFALGLGNEGYWFEDFNDISATNPDPPKLHGKPVDYWAAIDVVNGRL